MPGNYFCNSFFIYVRIENTYLDICNFHSPPSFNQNIPFYIWHSTGLLKHQPFNQNKIHQTLGTNHYPLLITYF